MIELEEGGGHEHKVRVPLGESFQISLRENPTTGFRWQLTAGGEPVCTLTSDHFTPGASPGAAGVHRWVFRANQVGEALVTMILRRAWTRNAEPAKSFVLQIRVEARGAQT